MRRRLIGKPVDGLGSTTRATLYPPGSSISAAPDGERGVLPPASAAGRKTLLPPIRHAFTLYPGRLSGSKAAASGCFWETLPDAGEYIVVGPAPTLDLTNSHDAVFLGLPFSTKWTKVSIGSSGIVWSLVRNNRKNRVIALGEDPTMSYQQHQHLAVSDDGGRTWDYRGSLVSAGLIGASDTIRDAWTLDDGGFVMISEPSIGVADLSAIVILRADGSLVSAKPSNSSHAVQDYAFSTYGAVNFVGGRLLAVGHGPDVPEAGLDGGLFEMAYSDDYGASWTDFERKGQAQILPDYGVPTSLYPIALHCLGDRAFIIGAAMAVWSDDEFETMNKVHLANYPGWNWQGAKYDQLNPETGYPIEWNEVEWGGAYEDFGHFEPTIYMTAKCAADGILCQGITNEFFLVEYDRFEMIGNSDMIAGNGKKNLVWSDQHGAMFCSNRSDLGVSGDGAHWDIWTMIDTPSGNEPPFVGVNAFRGQFSVAVGRTNDAEFYDSLKGFREDFDQDHYWYTP